MLDFEQACICIFDRSFPNVLGSGCYFHLRQSIHRKLQALGHQNKYENDPEFSHNIHKIAALAFLKPDDVAKGFEDLSMNLDDEYQTVLHYFEETYIGRLRANHTRRKPMFTIGFWIHIRSGQVPKSKKKNERFEKRLLHLISNPHQDILTQLDSIANNITL
ncbi:unnamed protein product [Rotaria socialis]|uniref:MULE transposase domain-containing protein n=1 Tax=Rotaria socialis TaxID=392032 RepID=A0A820INR1_9BILA|nr:unnamed protein product [Rotaria socialis]